MNSLFWGRKRPGPITTFYSFKGGVGRTMALANVAVLMAQQGRKVLALDWDFEAPGLHRYFLKRDEPELEYKRHEPETPQFGVLNLLHTLHSELCRRWPEGRGFHTEEAKAETRALIRAELARDTYRYRVRLENPNTKPRSLVAIDFVAAARFDESYPGLLAGFDWPAFYSDYAEFFVLLGEELAKDYDEVLIDARTGVTDIGSICTMLMPDKLVLVFSPNRQSLEGVLEAGHQAVMGRRQMIQELGGRRELPIFPLLSRVEDNEEKLKRQWVKTSRESFERLMGELEGRKIDLEHYFEWIRIPHRSYYAYGERIALEEETAKEAGSLAGVYQRLFKVLGAENVGDMIREAAMDRSEGLISTFEQLALSTALSESQRLMCEIMSLSSRATLYAIQGQHDELPSVYQTLHQRLDNLRDPTALGFALVGLIVEAKQRWLQGDEPGARAQIQALWEHAASAIKEASTTLYLPATAAYLAFLLGREDEAKSLLIAALAPPNSEANTGICMATASVFPLPQDNAFKKLLDDLTPPQQSPPAPPTPPSPPPPS